MQHLSHGSWRILVALVCLGSLLVGAPIAAQPRNAAPDDLQRAFADAANEFGVPQSVLLAVSYNLSRWEHHDGRPSTTGGYGVMHLVDLDDAATPDGKGDGIVRATPRSADPARHTLDAAARLLGVVPDALKRDVRQNVRGGAALLASYARTDGALPTTTGAWYAAVARFSGAASAMRQRSFADAVYATIERGVARTTGAGQQISLAAQAITPDRDSVPLPPAVVPDQDAECPPELGCVFEQAAYQRNNPDDPGDWGNYDLAQREDDGIQIDYIVIHDTETPYQATIDLFKNPLSYVSSHYVLRASDGAITQMVRNKDIAYTAGNYYVNTHAINFEHEGYALEGAAWYSEPMYVSSARLVRYLADRYGIPLDRAHIVGHDDVPAPVPSLQAGMHWDPGPFWDWAHYMELIGAPLTADTHATGEAVTIAPPFDTNILDFSDAPPQSASAVELRTEPRANAPLIADAALPQSGMAAASYWGSKAATGQQYAVADTQGDWTAIWFGGQQAWFYNPASAPVTLPARANIVKAKAGLDVLPIYGRAYPEASAYPDGIDPAPVVTMQYTVTAEQRYVTSGSVDATYYNATVFTTDPADNTLVRGTDQYYRIFFNHRFAFVKASDVDIIGAYQTSLPSVMR